MGNKTNNRKKEKIKGMGKKFFLEEWEICDTNDLNKSAPILHFDKNKLVSQIKKNPYDDYTAIKILGSGSYGKVLLVEHNITGMKRAMKQIRKSFSFQKSNEEAVLNELNILKKIDHQNVVKVYEYYVDNINYYIITEYCQEGDLFDAIKDKNLSEYQVACIMYQILLAVNHLHKMNIMHRDLKLENILVTKIEEDGLYRIKLCDFGTSHLFEEGHKEKKLIGSGYYMAPEVINKKYSFKCDIWSCGIIMYVLLTKKIPFLGDTKTELRHSIVKKKYIVEPIKKLSGLVQELIDDLIEKNENKRLNAEKALNYKIFDFYKCKERINKISFKIINNYIQNIKKYKKINILQETAITYLIHNSDLDEVNDAYKLFNKFDEDGNGKIDLEEFYKGLCKISEKKLNKKEITEIFYNIDTDKNNYIEQEEFAQAAVDKKIFLSEKMLKFAFNFFDDDKNGLITTEEIGMIFKNNNNNKNNDKNTSNEIKNIIKMIDKNDDGKISFEEFSQFMKSLFEKL